MFFFLLFFPCFLNGFSMISVGGRDARKEVGLNGARREMEDTELEEGEAWSYQNNEDFDSNIDPDIALSYIVSLLCILFYIATSRFSI